MPLRKYRRVEDIPPPPLAPTPVAGLVAACRMGELCARLGPGAVAPRGLHRFRSLEEADAHRERWQRTSPAPAREPRLGDRRPGRR